MQSLKDQVQELHRDLTKHHSLIKAEIMADILRKALQVDAQIGSEYASVEGMRAAFQEVPPSEDLAPRQLTPQHAQGPPPDRKGEKEGIGWCPGGPVWQALEPGSLLLGAIWTGWGCLWL